jgi:hypothetical protein
LRKPLNPVQELWRSITKVVLYDQQTEMSVRTEGKQAK